MGKRVIQNSLADLTTFIYSLTVSTWLVKYTPSVFMYFLMETQYSIRIERSLDSLSSLLYFLILVFVLSLLYKERFIESKLLYFGMYPLRIIIKSKFLSTVLLSFFILILSGVVYINFYVKYFMDEKVVQTTVMKSTCNCKKIDINGTIYYCFKPKSIKKAEIDKQ